MFTKTPIGFLAAFLVASSASAQMPLAQAVVSNETAKITLMKMQINDKVAQQMVDAAVDCTRNYPGGPSHLAVFVLAPTGYVVHSHVMDGVVPIGVEAAELKAKTVLFARTTSQSVADRYSTTESRLFRMGLGREGGLGYFLSAGGFPIVLEDNLIGALGLGGGLGEIECGRAALKVLGITPPPEVGPAGRGRAAGPAGGRSGAP